MSEDGFIAGENDNIDFLNPYQVDGEDYGYHEFISHVENILVGRKTYETVLGMGYPYHPDKSVYIATRSSRQSDADKHMYYNGNLKSLLNKLKSSYQSIIYCDGGAELARSLLAEDLIDEIILSVIPVKLETGILLFEKGEVPNSFSLNKKQTFSSGLVQLTYILNNSL